MFGRTKEVEKLYRRWKVVKNRASALKRAKVAKSGLGLWILTQWAEYYDRQCSKIWGKLVAKGEIWDPEYGQFKIKGILVWPDEKKGC